MLEPLPTCATTAEPADAYTYDPANPTPAAYEGGHIDGAHDTRKVSARDDVLVYTTPELTEDVEVVGPIEAKRAWQTVTIAARF